MADPLWAYANRQVLHISDKKGKGMVSFRKKSCRTILTSLMTFLSQKWREIGSIFFAGCMVLLLTACLGTEKKGALVLEETPPAEIYNEALALRAKGQLKGAAKRFDDLDRLYPYSDYARKALINLCYIRYTLKDYDDAIIAGRRYLRLYPGSPDAAYILYIVGQSYFDQIPDISRDQEVARRAYETFSDLINRYPKSEYVKDAEFKRRVAWNQLAGKELQIGRYYLKKRDYIAALNRFRVVVETYQTTSHVEEALARLAETYYALGVVSEAQTAAAVLGHNFPESSWYRSTYALLNKEGIAPEEDKESWISRSFRGTQKTQKGGERAAS